jgi:hypothetical protein
MNPCSQLGEKGRRTGREFFWDWGKPKSTGPGGQRTNYVQTPHFAYLALKIHSAYRQLYRHQISLGHRGLPRSQRDVTIKHD